MVSRTTASAYATSKESLPEIAAALGVRWVVEGGVGIEGDHVYLKVRAVDAKSDRKLWANAVDFSRGELVPACSKASESMAQAIMERLRAEAR